MRRSTKGRLDALVVEAIVRTPEHDIWILRTFGVDMRDRLGGAAKAAASVRHMAVKLGNARVDLAHGARLAGQVLSGGIHHAGMDWQAGAADAARTAWAAGRHGLSDLRHGAADATRDFLDAGRHQDLSGGYARAEQDLMSGEGRALGTVWDGGVAAAGQAYQGGVKAVRHMGAANGRAYDRTAEGMASGVSRVSGHRAGAAFLRSARALAQPVRQEAQQQFGQAQGIIEGGGSMLQGLGTAAVAGVRLDMDPEYRDRQLKRAKYLMTALGHGAVVAARHPRPAGQALKRKVGGAWQGFLKGGEAAARHGDEAEWEGRVTGRAAFEVASALVPGTKGVEAAGAARGLATVAGEGERLAAASGNAGRATDGLGHAAGPALRGGSPGRRLGALGMPRVAARARHGGPHGVAWRPSSVHPVEPAEGAADGGAGEGHPISRMLRSIRNIKLWGAKAPGSVGKTLEPRAAPSGMHGAGPGEIPKDAGLADGPRRAFGDSTRVAGPGRGARIAAARPLIHLSGSATETEAKLVLNRLAKNVPASMLKALHEAGVKIVVERDSITKRFPELDGARNSWNPELTKDAGSGMYVTDLKELVIASKPAGRAAREGVRRLPGVQDGVSVNVMLHELGHAVDFNVLGGTERNPLSASGAFRTALQMDERKSVPLPALSKIHDVLSDKYLRMGPAETFAEGYASFLTHPSEFEQAFPHLYSYFHSLSLDRAGRIIKKGVKPRYGDEAAPSFATRRVRDH